MAQKFVSLDEAADQLGVSKDRLNELRESGKVRAYRDGASWKFRSDDVDKLIADGIPSTDAGGSDIALGSDSAVNSGASAEPSSSGVDLDLGLEELAGRESASDINLDELDEPTVPVEAADRAAAEPDADDGADSILLSESELGESTDRPPSTIIGKAEMAADLDLDLAPSESDVAGVSDVKLAPTASNVFSSGPPSDAVLDTEPPSLSDNFGNLEELEIDLEAESSRILAPEDVEKAQKAAASKPKAKPQAAEISDLDLAPSDSDVGAAASSGALDGGSGGSASLSGLSGLSALELEGDDDEVLGDGSDITLSGESSGINIISPSDSGLALDDVSLDLTGSSPIASSIDLGSISGDVEIEPLEGEAAAAAEGEGDEPFTLTPFGEDAAEEEEDSSQIIPLDEVSEEDAADELLGVDRAEAFTDDIVTSGLGAGTAATGEPLTETPFSVSLIAGMSCCLLLLMLCGMMAFDLVRNIWSWDQVFSINSTLLEVVNPFLS
jgi:excisionase family DNA binding protein